MGGTWLSERELALVDGAEKLSFTEHYFWEELCDKKNFNIFRYYIFFNNL